MVPLPTMRLGLPCEEAGQVTGVEPMPKYIVEKREVWTQMVEIAAKDAEEAKLLVSRGGGRVLDGAMEYSHDLDTDHWTVEEE